MGIARRTVAVFFSAIVCLAAQAQQPAGQAPSPYSLGLSADRGGPGLSLSVVGRAHLSSFDLFGKLGTTTYARPDTSAMGIAAAPVSAALSWGGGVSYDFTPRLSATFEWISYDLRMPNGPMRSTNLGLKYRY